MQKRAHLVELEKCCQTHIFLQSSFWYSRERARQKFAKWHCKSFKKKLQILQSRADRSLGSVFGSHVPAAAAARPLGAPARPRRARRVVDPGVVANFWQIFGKISLVFGCYRHRSLQVKIYQRFALSRVTHKGELRLRDKKFWNVVRKFSEKLVENLVKNLLKKCYLGKKCNLANFQRKIFENTKSGMPVVSLLC